MSRYAVLTSLKRASLVVNCRSGIYARPTCCLPRQLPLQIQRCCIMLGNRYHAAAGLVDVAAFFALQKWEKAVHAVAAERCHFVLPALPAQVAVKLLQIAVERPVEPIGVAQAAVFPLQRVGRQVAHIARFTRQAAAVEREKAACGISGAVNQRSNPALNTTFHARATSAIVIMGSVVSPA